MDDKPKGLEMKNVDGTETVEKPRIEPGDIARYSHKYRIDLTEVQPSRWPLRRCSGVR